MNRLLDEAAQALEAVRGLTLRRDEPLASHTSLRLGGPARLWIEPSTLDHLCLVLAALGDVRWMVIGGGTNVLFDDRGFDGAVVCTRSLRGCAVAGRCLSALAGTTLGEAVRVAVEHGVGGLERLWGIPGTVGGAVAGNAGACGQEAFDCLEEVVLVGNDGVPQTVAADAFDSGYRRGGVPAGKVVAHARWSLTERDPSALADAMNDAMRRRQATQPWDRPTAGCTFRNPPGESAGRLIEQAGLKGARVGGATVSTRHANFIVLDGPATSGDVRALIDVVRARVEESAGIVLEPELVIVEYAA